MEIKLLQLKNKIIDLKSDLHAQVADHICVVETWLDPKTEYNFNISGRYIFEIQFLAFPYPWTYF